MRLMIPLLLSLATDCPALAQVQADFIDGTYVFAADACEKLRALAKGTTPSVMTEPWAVGAAGISFWEGRCGFSKVEKRGTNTWHVTASCEENGDDHVETYIFRRTSKTTFAVELTTKGTTAEKRIPKTYRRCDVP